VVRVPGHGGGAVVGVVGVRQAHDIGGDTGRGQRDVCVVQGRTAAQVE